MKAQLQSLHLTLRRPSIKQSFFVSGGTVVNGFLGFVFYVLIGRSLSVTDFGTFSFLLAIGILAADLGDWGIDPAIVKFGSVGKLSELFSLGLVQRMIVGFVLLTLAIIAQLLYPANFLLSALVGWFLLLLYLVTQSFLARQKFFTYSLINIFGNVIRLGLVFALLVKGLLTVETSLAVFILGNFFALAAGYVVLKKITEEPLLDFTNLRQTAAEIFPFSLWSGLSFMVSALAVKLDNPAVYFFAGSKEAGLYSSAQKLSSVFPQVASSLDSVFAPKLSAPEEEKSHFRDYLTVSIILGFSLLLLIPFAQPIISLYSSKYLSAVFTLQLLLMGMALFLLTGPFSTSVLYRFGKSKLIFVNSLSQLALVLCLYYLLLPHYGSYGAGIAFIISQLVNMIFYVGCFLILKNKHD